MFFKILRLQTKRKTESKQLINVAVMILLRKRFYFCLQTEAEYKQLFNAEVMILFKNCFKKKCYVLRK